MSGVEEVLTAHILFGEDGDDQWTCGDERGQGCHWTTSETAFEENFRAEREHRAHVAEQLQPLIRQAQADALRQAAQDAQERGDIGKDNGVEAWVWLRARAERIGEMEA